jgi:hypothetical protein
MSAGMNTDIKDFITLFRETWAECQAFRAIQSLEGAEHNANWEKCFRTAQDQAEDVFQPIFSDLEHDLPLPATLRRVRLRLEEAAVAEPHSVL